LQRTGQFAVFRRDLQGDALNRFLDDPEAFMQRGECLKNGVTSTVVRVRAGDCDWVVKRNNIKGLRHAIKRSLRPTRAWTSWQNSHRLKISGIGTPRAVAMIEKRFGPLRSTGYYVCDFIDAPNTQEVFRSAVVPVAVKELLAGKFVHLFDQFRKLRIHHGDCKATNFLFKDNHLWVLDLDAMRECSTAFGFARLFRIDRRRFLCNWKEQPQLQQWFDEHLPGKEQE
jgi:tRNA A-37 threonylcarbamoyl transferase component Bud32